MFEINEQQEYFYSSKNILVARINENESYYDVKEVGYENVRWLTCS